MIHTTEYPQSGFCRVYNVKQLFSSVTMMTFIPGLCRFKCFRNHMQYLTVKIALIGKNCFYEVVFHTCSCNCSIRSIF